MFGVKTLIEKLNTAINSGSLTELQLAQAFGAIDSLEKHGVNSVETVADLPNVVLNKGRFFWINSENRYILSNGFTWDINNIIRYNVNLYTWGGSGRYGQFGDNSTNIDRNSPVPITGGFTDWVQASAGPFHNVGIRANGTLWAWGYASNGRLGNNILNVNRSSPVSVLGGFTDWIQASAGNIHSLGLRANGTLYSWGNNGNGILGDGTTAARSSPALVAGGFTDWIQASAGDDHSLGVRANGTLWSWGRNDAGKLGHDTGTAVIRSSPASVVGGFTDWVQASAGATHSLGVRANGTLYAWGNAANGRSGDNTSNTSKSSPALVVGGFTDWIQTSAGAAHSLGLRANGTIWSWGSSGTGRLGDSASTDKSSPVSVVGGFTDWIQVYTDPIDANPHNIGIRANGTMWTWGNNTYGKLGINIGVGANRSSPVSVVGGFTDWVSAAAGPTSIGIRG